MPKRPPRSQRRGQRRPSPRLVMPPPPTPTTAPSIAATVPAPAPVELAKERSLSRFTARDYSYVRREMIRIVIIATAMLIIIFVLSFFLP